MVDQSDKSLAEMAQQMPVPLDIEIASQRFDEIVGSDDRFSKLAPKGSPAASVLMAIFGASSYLTDLIGRDREGAMRDLATPPEQRHDEILNTAVKTIAEAGSGDAAAAALRQTKAASARHIAFCDLSGAWSVDQVIVAVSDVADRLIGLAVDWLLCSGRSTEGLVVPQARAGYIVLAMGKHGAGELNYSSDVDLIVLFDPVRAKLADEIEPQRFFVRLTKDLVRLLQDRTADGYVYRTDLRLRPDPGATNVAISVSAAAAYYEGMGQNWERAAMIKARPVAGDIEAGEAFLDELAPFVWRKYLDFASIADVHSIKRQIQAQRGHSSVAIPGHNIKLGRGGIREIEFFVQTQQLIAGGRQPELRLRGTLKSLNRLAELGWIDAAARDELSAAYRVLRRVENRLQMVDDQQTHSLPTDPEALGRFAGFAGYEDAADLENDLRAQMAAVERHYAALFEEAPSLGDDAGSLVFTGTDDDPETLETLVDMGFSDVALVSRTVRAWHYGRIPATRSSKSRARLTELMPALLKAFSRSEHPDQALIAFDRFLAQLPAGVQLFSLLCAYPGLLHLVADIMGTAPRLAHVLSQRPRTLEVVIDNVFAEPLPDQAGFRNLADEAVNGSQIMEEILDNARAFGQEQLFRIGVQVLSGVIPADDVGRGYSDLAASLIEILLEAVRHDFASTHGHVPGGEVAVLGMGKLGGREMTATSDLDLILIYDVPDGVEESDGRRPLTPGLYYTRLTQRLISALSVPTAEGRLFEVDLRLRPSGRSGPLATRLSAFRDYHRKSAWTWEKMALTRARFVAGDAVLGDTVTAMVTDLIRQPVDPSVIAQDVAAMRARIAADKGTEDPWSLKQVRGGLIDLEFIAQYLQLVHGHSHPDVLHTGTSAAIEAIRSRGLIDGDIALDLVAACRLYQQLTQLLRLSIGADGDVRTASEGLKRRLARAADMPDYERLQVALIEMQAVVTAHFSTIIGRIGNSGDGLTGPVRETD